MQVVQALEENLLGQGKINTVQVGIAALVTDASSYVRVTVGANGMVVLTQAFTSSEEAVEIALYEGAATGGTPNVVVNRNQNYPPENSIGFLVGATYTPGTPILKTVFRAGTTGNNASLVINAENSKLYLKANTAYVIGIKNLAGQAADIGMSLTFRETVNGI